MTTFSEETPLLIQMNEGIYTFKVVVKDKLGAKTTYLTPGTLTVNPPSQEFADSFLTVGGDGDENGGDSNPFAAAVGTGDEAAVLGVIQVIISCLQVRLTASFRLHTVHTLITVKKISTVVDLQCTSFKIY